MFLAYIDESGKPQRNNPEDFVLSAVVINEKDRMVVDNHVKILKIKHFPKLSDEQVELHATDIVHKAGIYKDLDSTKRNSILTDVYDLVSSINCCIISTLIHKQKIWKSDFDVELWGLRFLFERLCLYLYLEKRNKELTSKKLQKVILLMIGMGMQDH